MGYLRGEGGEFALGVTECRILAYNALDFGERFDYLFEGLGAVAFGWGYYGDGGCGCGDG